MSFWNFIGDMLLLNAFRKLFSKKDSAPSNHSPMIYNRNTDIIRDPNPPHVDDLYVDDLYHQLDELESQLDNCDVTSEHYDSLQQRIDMLEDQIDELEDARTNEFMTEDLDDIYGTDFDHYDDFDRYDDSGIFDDF